LNPLSCDSILTQKLFEMSSAHLTEKIRKLSRLAVAIGGFLIMIGMILVNAVVLSLMNIVDLSTFTNETYLLMFMLALFSVGMLDIIAGVILSRR